jgi:hypothetical protein
MEEWIGRRFELEHVHPHWLIMPVGLSVAALAAPIIPMFAVDNGNADGTIMIARFFQSLCYIHGDCALWHVGRWRRRNLQRHCGWHIGVGGCEGIVDGTLAGGIGKWQISGMEGILDGALEGKFEGMLKLEGDCKGAVEGNCEGIVEGVVVGDCEGVLEGILVGSLEGDCKGISRRWLLLASTLTTCRGDFEGIMVTWQ